MGSTIDFNENPGDGWTFIREKFDATAQESTGAIFNRWNVPQ